VKEYILTGKNVVDVINNLPVNEENQIDAAHIKNLPQGNVRGVGSFGVREAPKDGKQYARKDRDWVEVVTGGGQVDTVVAGTGITVDATDPANPIVTNDNPTPYSLPKAAAATLGGIKVGDRLSIDANGVLSADAQSGSGDVTGPTGATADDIATFDGATGKLIKDGGAKISALVPYTGATADLDLGVHEVKTSSVHANSSAGVTVHNTSGEDVALFGAGGGKGATFYDGVILDAQTANKVAILGATKNIIAADTGSAVKKRTASRKRGKNEPVVDIYFRSRKEARLFLAKMDAPVFKINY
jgi:hypothetical protein